MNIQSCINCGIALKERIRRHAIPSLSADMSSVLSGWLTIMLSPESFICGACYHLLKIGLETHSRERQLGHANVCYGCGKSVAFVRRCAITAKSPVALVVSSWHQCHHARQANFLCHACNMKAKREVARRNAVDNIKLRQIEDNGHDQGVQVPIPPPLPPVPVIRSVTDVAIIVLPNYKRCANTSRRCIFDGCQRSAGHLVPNVIKSRLLSEHKLYIPRCARTCKEHLVSNDWEMLLDNTSLSNSFTAHQIESLLDSKNEDTALDFEKIETMPSHICHYWTGRSTEDFMDLYNSIPIQSVVPKKSKTALATLLMKYRTGDSDARISSLLRIPKSTLQYRMNLVRNCLKDHLGEDSHL